MNDIVSIRPDSNDISSPFVSITNRHYEQVKDRRDRAAAQKRAKRKRRLDTLSLILAALITVACTAGVTYLFCALLTKAY